ncbi:MAG: N-formylglutamate amidohydrolase [Legionella sp.]|nr:MAG: N-formylglutamate amidohydrolase [Legionella sp.]
MNKKLALILSCEHATNHIPEAYSHLFAPYNALLNSHQGVDFGALSIAQHLHKALDIELVQAQTSRLLIDCNRSLRNPRCFSEITRALPLIEKDEIIQRYYLPFRAQVTQFIEQNITQSRQVWHLSIHSFTPILNDIIRTADIGFLYDPRRTSEKLGATLWQKEMNTLAPEYRVRMNYPYKGISDGFTSYLRKQYTAEQYVGIEIETNQSITQDEQAFNKLKIILTQSLFNQTS